MSALDKKAVLQLDGYLEPFYPAIEARHETFQKWVNTINESEGGLDKFSKGYEKFGLHALPNGDVVYREWAPNAKEAHLIGDFSKSSLTLDTRLI